MESVGDLVQRKETVCVRVEDNQRERENLEVVLARKQFLPKIHPNVTRLQKS